jgi:hypothetical protein
VNSIDGIPARRSTGSAHHNTYVHGRRVCSQHRRAHQIHHNAITAGNSRWARAIPDADEARWVAVGRAAGANAAAPATHAAANTERSILLKLRNPVTFLRFEFLMRVRYRYFRSEN